MRKGQELNAMARQVVVSEPGRVEYAAAWDLQRELAARRKAGEIPDQLLLLEHPHVITLGRNSKASNLLASPQELRKAGIAVHEIDRGGDVTYHGPGQIVGYPIVDLREWKRDVVAYVRAVEEAVIQALARLGVAARRDPGATGVWVDPPGADAAKICAIGIHISRWVTTHGFALNWTTGLRYFQYIVPCGLTRPVTSLEALGVQIAREEAHRALVEAFAQVFDWEPVWPSALAGAGAGCEEERRL